MYKRVWKLSTHICNTASSLMREINCKTGRCIFIYILERSFIIKEYPMLDVINLNKYVYKIFGAL